jgi:hypothetical protein
MQYQDYYSMIRPTSMYDTVKAAQQDRLVNQENQLIMQQKQFAFNKQKATSAYKTLSAFKKLTPEQQAAQWTQTRQTLESIYPEKKGAFPSSWGLDPQGNARELDAFLSGISKLVEPERVTIKEGEVIQERMPGGEFQPILIGPKKEEKGLEIKTTVVGDTYIETPERPLPSGNILRGPFVYDQMGNAMPKEEYFNLYPSEKPKDLRPESQNKLNTIPQAVPTTPQAVPGQIELPPRQFNVPSPTNRAGETNQGYGIDENAMLQQPQIMPSMGNMMLKGAGAVMADEYAPQPRNALVGETMPPPSQFAELLPAGSAPNRFGSPGVEGMDFAYTGAAKPQIVNGRVVYTAPPKPVKADNPKDRLRPATNDELARAGIPADTGLIYLKNETTGEITPVERLDKLDQARKAIENDEAMEGRGLSAAQRDKAQSEAEEARKKLRVMRAAQMSAIRQVIDVEDELLSLSGNEFVDTGPLDTFARFTGTATGKKLTSIDKKALAMNNAINHAIKITGAGSQSDADVELMLNAFPTSSSQYSDNMDIIRELKMRIMDYIGLDAVVRNDNDFNSIPVGSIFYDSRSKTILRKVKE